MQEIDEDDDGWADDDDGYIACPHCGETMLEDAEYCPSCDMWMTGESVKKKSPSWWIVGVILILVATIILGAISR